MGNSLYLHKKKKNEDYDKAPFFFIEFIKDRIAKNKNFLAVWCGQTGSGKSLAAIRMAEILDPEFKIEQVVFNPLDFMRLIKHGDLRPGAVIVFDETGVEAMNSRNWYSQYNQLMNHVLQTFRYRGIIVFFTVPDFKFIDSNARKLLHCYFEPKKIDHKNKTSRSKALLLQNNPQMGKIYYKYLRASYKGQTFQIRTVSLGLPSERLLRAYELKKHEFAENLYDKIVENFSIQDPKNTSDDKINTGKVPLSEKQQKVYDLLKQGYSQKDIAEQMEMKYSSQVSLIKKAIAKKGYVIK